MAITKIPTELIDTTSHMDFLDGEKLRLGTSNDLQLYHDASNSYINDTGTGALYIKSNYLAVAGANGHQLINAEQGAAVELFHNNTRRLSTSSTGITVTGDISGTTATASGGTSTTALASTAFVQQELTTLIGGAPSTLNDLNELAAAINDDANYNSTLTTALATKLPLAGGTMTGTITVAGSSSGTVDALIITNTDTTNNGLSIGVDSSENAFFWNGSNTSMNFATNNTARMTIDSSGNSYFQGAGHTNLEVRSGSASTKAFMQTVQDTDIRIGSSTNHPVAFYANGQERLKINNSTGNINIGSSLMVGSTASPSTYDSRANNLVVGDSGDSGITIFSGANSDARLQFAPSGSTGLDNGLIGYDNATDKMVFATGGSDRVAIDSSGNLLVGRTSASFGSDTGLVLRPNNDSYIIANDSPSLTMRRNNSDGAIAQFYKAGTLVGSIGTDGGSLAIGGGDVGIGFYQSANALVPYNGVTALRDAAIDLGMASSGRYKDLYLSGTVNAVQLDITAGTDAKIYTSNSISEVGNGNFAIQSVNTAGSALKPLGFRAEDIRFATGSAERLRIDTSGALILNNSGGDAQMYFGGTSGTSRMYLARAGLDSLLYNVSNGNLRFGTNNQERMRIDSSGNVGIGTGAGAPQGMLHVAQSKGSAGNLWSQVGAGNTPSIHIQNTANTANVNAALYFRNSSAEKASIGARFVNQSTGQSELRFSVTNSSGATRERMTLSGDGTLCIGESIAPNSDASMEIKTAAPNTGVTTLRLTNAVNNKGQRIDFYDDNAARAFTLSHDNGNNITYMGTLVDESFAFYTNSAERMRITNNGDIGIGETSPLGKLHVKTADSGATAHADSNELVVESNNDAGISILSGQSYSGRIYFGDAGVNYDGSITYSQALRSMIFGTAGDERMRIKPDGNVIIGGTDVANANSSLTIDVNSSSANARGLHFYGGADVTNKYISIGRTHTAGNRFINSEVRFGAEVGGNGASFLSFSTGTGNNNEITGNPERMRITSTGNVGIGVTAAPSGSTGGFWFSTDQFYTSTTSTSSNYQIRMYNGNGLVGSIVTNGSATAFNTSSDYRLKENVDYTWDATTRLKQLKPARFNFIVDDTNTLVDGFLAHEVEDIVPEAVTGEKDGEEMQSIDQSKLVPLLVKTIQELEARIAALEA